LKVLVVPDKFKGTLPAAAAAAAIIRGWRRARPRDGIEALPMSDGGDGFGEVLSHLLKARAAAVRTVDAAHRRCSVRWWWEPKRQVAIVETARVIGLAMLPRGRFHPFELDTFGLGAVLRAAEAKGARRVLIGIGGSATNDGGFGLARSLGWDFLDRNGSPIRRWTELARLREIRKPARPLRIRELVVAVDVQNPLLGARGATRVYGPQKGLRASQFASAERNLRRLAEVVGNGFSRQPGSGAAGGLGFGLLAFAGARLEPGFQLFAQLAELDRRLRAADLVITGEGAIDRSSLMGKGVGEIARSCRVLELPCLGLGGAISLGPTERRWFTRTAALTELATVEQAKARPALWLERLAHVLGSAWQLGKF
jgi:glycerate kinase